MRPFEFIILFFSFIYTLALTHILFAATRMIRYRRQLVFSWPHALWMLNALIILGTNWLSLWDFHEKATLSLELVVTTFFLVVGQYFMSALIAPDFEGEDGYDMQEFHRRERRTYLGALAVLVVFGIGVNMEAAARFGLSSWGQENLIGIPMLGVVLAGMLIPWRWVQIASPLILLGGLVALTMIYYPALK